LGQPLRNADKVHEAEERQEDDEAGENLDEQGQVISEENAVLTLLENSQGHVEHAKNYRHFHLDSVCDCQFVCLRNSPSRVHTNWVLAGVG
jgi:hypothetical protein